MFVPHVVSSVGEYPHCQYHEVLLTCYHVSKFKPHEVTIISLPLFVFLSSPPSLSLSLSPHTLTKFVIYKKFDSKCVCGVPVPGIEGTHYNYSIHIECTVTLSLADGWIVKCSISPVNAVHLV